jgi:GxxExxY protein
MPEPSPEPGALRTVEAVKGVKEMKGAGEAGGYEDERYPLSSLTSRIIACAVEVHKTLGPGFEELFYQRALHREFAAAGLEATREVDIEVHYKEEKLGTKRIDFVVENCLVEIKAKDKIDEVAIVQTLSYLYASGFPVALLINFGGPKIEVRRLMNTRNKRGVRED